MLNGDVLVMDGETAAPYSLLCLLKRYGYRLVPGKAAMWKSPGFSGETGKIPAPRPLKAIRIPRLSPMALIDLLDYLEEDEVVQPIYTLSGSRDRKLIDTLHDCGCDNLLMGDGDPESAFH